jgi:hypothetical protein
VTASPKISALGFVFASLSEEEALERSKLRQCNLQMWSHRWLSAGMVQNLINYYQNIIEKIFSKNDQEKL